MSPPEAQARTQEPFGVALNGAERQAAKVDVINPGNGARRIRRKDANHHVATGRAEWIGDRLRFLEFHPKNLAAAARAAGGNGIAELRQLPAFDIPWTPLALPHGPGIERRVYSGPSGIGIKTEPAELFVVVHVDRPADGILGAKAVRKIGKIDSDGKGGVAARARQNAKLHGDTEPLYVSPLIGGSGPLRAPLR